MNLGLDPLLATLRARPDTAFVLATVIGTQGSSYRKSGAMMLIAPDTPPVGLVSGGCLEADLVEHARRVFDAGCARHVVYDLSRDEAELWGLGLGCGGAITIALEPAHRDNGFAGLADVAEHWAAARFCWLAKTVRDGDPAPQAVVAATDGALPPPARALIERTHARTRAARGTDGWLLVPVAPPPSITVCGAGPDAVPLANLALASGWRVRVVDHRDAFADTARFDAGVDVCKADARDVGRHDAVAEADAVVVMAHHLQRDAAYLRGALDGRARYVGLLGPPARRDEVLALCGRDADARLHGPAGLDIGADLPETIALSILAEAHAVLHGRAGGRLRGTP